MHWGIIDLNDTTMSCTAESLISTIPPCHALRNHWSQQYHHVMHCRSLISTIPPCHALRTLPPCHVLRNHWYFWGPLFVGCQHMAGSWGHNFVDSLFLALQCKTIINFVKGLWGCSFVGKSNPRTLIPHNCNLRKWNDTNSRISVIGITGAWHRYYNYRVVYLSMRNSTTSLWLNAAAMWRGVAISSFSASILAWCWTKSFTHLNKSEDQKIRNTKIRKPHRADCGDYLII